MLLLLVAWLGLHGGLVQASIGDRLPEFGQCLQVRHTRLQSTRLRPWRRGIEMG